MFASHVNEKKYGITNHKVGLASLMLSLSVAAIAQTGIIMEFTGGDIIAGSGGAVSNIDGINSLYSATEYHESGVKMTAIGSDISLGSYYAKNAVIHGHWSQMTQVKFEMVDGSAFDMNYYKLTSNPSRALGHGGAASDAVVSMVASVDGTTESFRTTLPAENWGDEFGGDKSVTEVYLGPEFDGIKAFWFESDKATFQCFGMDNYYIDRPPPAPTTPNPIVLGSGSVEDAVSGKSPAPDVPVPTMPYYLLMLLSFGLGIFGVRKLRR